ncbi:cytochrome b6-f (plastid) [Lotharella oceanica]|uniref:Cytochrome b6-f n=1 Tax=Lotharella oceanica TaxID=641309 RepID=A0A059SNW0_9EUKA|nr:cytochrome b6-f [Lotharella oceanica]
MIELFLFGIILGLLSGVLAGLFVSAYYQYKRNK